MAIPESVRRQSEEADRAMAEFEKPEVVDTPVINTPEPAPVLEPVINPTPEPVQSQQVDGPSAEEYNRMKSEYDRLVAETSSQPYKTLQGKYNAEVVAVRGQMRDMQQQIDMLSRAPQQPIVPKPVHDGKPPHLRYLTDAEIAELDKDALDVQSRIARGVAESQAEKLREENRGTEQRINNTENRVSRMTSDNVWSSVERVHPGIQTMNTSNDPRWLNFLNSEDDVTGIPYREVGERAISTGDSARLLKLVDKFKAVSGLNANNQASSVASQIKPKVAGSEATPVKDSKPYVKESTYNKFINEVTRGLWKGREKDRDKLMNDFQSAIHEGRVLEGQ